MKVAIIGLDKPNSVSLRMSKREERRAFLHGDIGTPVVIEGPSLASAQQLVADDFFIRAGRFARLDIMPWRSATVRWTEA